MSVEVAGGGSGVAYVGLALEQQPARLCAVLAGIYATTVGVD
jgi:hypothetical protein